MISTTDGYAIFLSTPWARDHFFYRAFMNPNYSVHKVKSSECPLIKPEFLEEMRRNMTETAFKMDGKPSLSKLQVLSFHKALSENA